MCIKAYSTIVPFTGQHKSKDMIICTFSYSDKLQV